MAELKSIFSDFVGSTFGVPIAHSFRSCSEVSCATNADGFRRQRKMLTDVPKCVFGKCIAPLLALDDLYRLANSSRAMSLIAKASIQNILEKDFDMTELVHEAAYRVATNIGLPIDFQEVRVLGSKVHPAIKFFGTIQNHENPLRKDNYSEISIYDGHLTVDRGLVWRFPGQVDEVQVKFVFMLPRRESILGGLGCYSITSMDGRNEITLGNMSGGSRNCLDRTCGGESFQEVMREWDYAAKYWEDDRMDYWDREDNDNDWGSVDDDEGDSMDYSIGEEVIFVNDIDTGKRNTEDCILLGDDDCMIIEDA